MICAQLHPSHMSVHVGDSLQRSEEIVKKYWIALFNLIIIIIIIKCPFTMMAWWSSCVHTQAGLPFIHHSPITKLRKSLNATVQELNVQSFSTNLLSNFVMIRLCFHYIVYLSAWQSCLTHVHKVYNQGIQYLVWFEGLGSTILDTAFEITPNDFY